MQQKQLKTAAGKGLYKLLNQWRTVGIATYDTSEIRKALDISDDQPQREVTRKLKTAIVDLQKRIPEQYSTLSVVSNKNGRVIVSYTFEFDKEEAMIKSKDRYEIDYYGYVLPQFTQKEMEQLVDMEYINSLRSRPFVKEKDIQEEIRRRAYDTYWKKMRVTTEKFNSAVFEAKTDNLFLSLAEVYGKQEMKNLRTDILEAIAEIKNKELIYEINNFLPASWIDLIRKCEDLKDEGKVQSTTYLKKVIENHAEKHKVIKSVKEIF